MVRKASTLKTVRKKPAAKTTGIRTVAAIAKAITASDEAAELAPRAMGKRELIDRVVVASGIKKKAAKPVIEAMLKELGDALSRGENLNLQPFGKGIVKSRKDLENAEIVELRLRRSKLAVKAAEAAAEAIAEDNEGSRPVLPDPRLVEAAE